MSEIEAPTPEQTLEDYLGKFQTDDDRAAATLVFRTKAIGVKVLNEETGLLGGWGIPFGGPVQDKDHSAGKDLDGEYFDAQTNFCTEWFPNDNRPVLYDHGTDPEVQLQVVGRQTSKFTDPKLGVWVETQLDMANKYASYILELAKKGVLGYSSGALGGYVRKDAKTGRITQWPWVEQTVTVRPANPYALIARDAVKHLEMAGLLEPSAPPTLGDALKAELEAKAVWSSSYINDLPDSAFADPTDRKYPHHDSSGNVDEAHVVDGLARARQNDAGSAVIDHLLAHEKALGIGEGAGKTEDIKAGRMMNARNLGQMHQSIKALADLHNSTCDMGTDCPMYDASTTKAVTPDDPAVEAQRQEIDDFLATIELRRGRYA